jgi:hypothetical protein
METCSHINCWITQRGDESIMNNLYHLLILCNHNVYSFNLLNNVHQFFGYMYILRKGLFLEGKAQFWRRTTGRKSSMCKEKSHAKEKSMQGMQEGKSNHARVMILVDILMDNKLVK